MIVVCLIEILMLFDLVGFWVKGIKSCGDWTIIGTFLFDLIVSYQCPELPLRFLGKGLFFIFVLVKFCNYILILILLFWVSLKPWSEVLNCSRSHSLNGVSNMKNYDAVLGILYNHRLNLILSRFPSSKHSQKTISFLFRIYFH